MEGLYNYIYYVKSPAEKKWMLQLQVTAVTATVKFTRAGFYQFLQRSDSSSQCLNLLFQFDRLVEPVWYMYVYNYIYLYKNTVEPL